MSAVEIRLAPDQLQQLADLVAAQLQDKTPRAHTGGLLRQKAAGGLVDAATVAEALGVARRWVYDHADELGVISLGSGPKARKRFDLEAACEAMTRSSSGRSQAENVNEHGRSGAQRRSRGRRLPIGLPEPGSVLSIRPSAGAQAPQGRAQPREGGDR